MRPPPSFKILADRQSRASHSLWQRLGLANPEIFVENVGQNYLNVHSLVRKAIR